MLFSKKKDPGEGLLFSPATGEAVPIAEVPDKVFSEKILGDGVAVLLTDGLITSPANGKIITVADTYHAYGIETSDGMELIIHIGIDTVKLDGQGFRSHVREGQKIKKGDKLCEVDLNVLRENNCPLYTPVLITNMDGIQEFNITTGSVTAGETVVVEYKR